MQPNRAFIYGCYQLVAKSLNLSSDSRSLPQRILGKWSATRFSEPILSPNLIIKFLQKQDPPHKFRLSIILRNQMLNSRVVSINNYMRLNQARSKLFKTEDRNQKFFLSDSIIQLHFIQSVTTIINDMRLLINVFLQNNPTAQSDASHISSKGSPQT